MSPYLVRPMAQIDSREGRDFIGLPFQIYRNGSAWISPLLREIRFKLDLRHNPFYRHGEVQAFVAYCQHGIPCGRIAAITNRLHQEVHRDSSGFFGLFESVNDIDVAYALFDSAGTFLRGRGCNKMIGPVNLSTNDESGLLLDGSDRPPTFMCNYCPPYYHELLAGCGFIKAVDTLSYETCHGHPFPEKYQSVLRRAEMNQHVSLRRFSRRHARRDIEQIRHIYDTSFQGTWGFVPMTYDEAQLFGSQLLQFADLDLVWIADYDDAPVGMILGFPDLNEILRYLDGRLMPFGFARILLGRRRIQNMRVAAFGVLPNFRRRGIESLLIRKVHQRINDRPYQRAEFSVVMEENQPMRQLLEGLGFKRTRSFRIYQVDLS